MVASDSEGGASKGVYQRTVQAADDLVSVTVRKSEPSQKAGISLVERQGAVYVTKVTEHGLFHNTEIEIGDLVLSINGKRLKKGEGARDIIKHISNSKSTVTMVVKKANRKAKRGSRSLSPMSQRRRRQPQKLFKKIAHRNADGSLKYDLDPRLENLKKQDEVDNKVQIPIIGNKIFAKQEIGVMFKDIDKMIFVCGITQDSVLGDTELELGDRVVSVNGMNFMTYADANYATKLCQRATKEVTLVVEKGHTNFKAERDTDSGHNVPNDLLSPRHTQGSIGRNLSVGGRINISEDDSDGSDSSDNILSRMLSKGSGHRPQTPAKGSKPVKFKKAAAKPKSSKAARAAKVEISDYSDESPLEEEDKPKTTKIKSKAFRSSFVKNDIESDEESLEDFTAKGNSSIGSLKSPLNRRSLSKLAHESLSKSMDLNFNYDQYVDDYMKVTVQKKSEFDPGLAMEKTEGKFILTAVPEYERRIAVGMQVLAINGVMNINTSIKAADLIKRTEEKVVLIIDNSPPTDKDLTCACCGELITANGKHVNDSSSSPKKSTARGRGRTRGDEGSVSASVGGSVADSVMTAKASNKTPGGKAKIEQTIPETSGHYNYDEYESDSDGSDEEEKPKRAKKRPSVTRYQPNDKFMVRVTKKDQNQALLLSLFDHKGSIYIAKVFEGSPFYSTPVQQGDKILSINGRKVSLIKNAANALGILEERDAISLFVVRSDPHDKDYMEAMAQRPR